MKKLSVIVRNNDGSARNTKGPITFRPWRTLIPTYDTTRAGTRRGLWEASIPGDEFARLRGAA
jgi:hypothetical protein